MFERFTDRARRVVVLAREEAGTLNHDQIDVEHLLLGMIHEGGGIAGQVLAESGVTQDNAREWVAAMTDSPQRVSSGSMVPFTSQAITVFNQSFQQALRLGHNYIGTEHLLLSLIGQEESVAAKILSRSGVSPNQIRSAVLKKLEIDAGSLLAAGLSETVRLNAELAGLAAEKSRLEMHINGIDGRMDQIAQRLSDISALTF